MHEVSIVMSVIREVTRHIDEGALEGRVRSVHLTVGKMVAALPDNLTFLFGILTSQTPLEGARLDIEEVPVRIRCRACGQETEIGMASMRCSSCGERNVEVASGRELNIDYVELE